MAGLAFEPRKYGGSSCLQTPHLTVCLIKMPAVSAGWDCTSEPEDSPDVLWQNHETRVAVSQGGVREPNAGHSEHSPEVLKVSEKEPPLYTGAKKKSAGPFKVELTWGRGLCPESRTSMSSGEDELALFYLELKSKPPRENESPEPLLKHFKFLLSSWGWGEAVSSSRKKHQQASPRRLVSQMTYCTCRLRKTDYVERKEERQPEGACLSGCLYQHPHG